MKLKYIYSACVVIETPDCRICCDPWFTQGAYDGSWFQYPRLEDPITAIGRIDYVYVSHIHPDHYDVQFLKSLLLSNPDCVVIVGSENQHFLVSKMLRDGFTPVSISRLSVGETEIGIFPNFAYGEMDIDSALVVKAGNLSVVNMNDCAFDENQVKRIREFCEGNPDLACLPYAGAGPYPQMYRFENDDERTLAAAQKKDQFINLFGRYLVAFNPKIAMPFAGLYFLGGALRSRNEYRGVPDALEVKAIFGQSVLVLQEGIGEIDLVSGDVKFPRTEPHDIQQRENYLAQFDGIAFPYESTPRVGLHELVSLLERAHHSAMARIKDPPTRSICFQVFTNQFLCVQSEQPGNVLVRSSIHDLTNRELIEIDDRLLYGLLTRRFHWNNAEIGSHFEFSRTPNSYDRKVYSLLNFLHV